MPSTIIEPPLAGSKTETPGVARPPELVRWCVRSGARWTIRVPADMRNMGDQGDDYLTKASLRWSVELVARGGRNKGQERCCDGPAESRENDVVLGRGRSRGTFDLDRAQLGQTGGGSCVVTICVKPQARIFAPCLNYN